MYSSANTELFQREPSPYSSYDIPPESWTESIPSYTRCASKLARCVDRVRRAYGIRLLQHVTINFNDFQSPTDARSNWNRVKRRLDAAGIVAFWVREAGKSDKVHNHLLVTNSWPPDVIKTTCQDALRDCPSRTSIKSIDNPWLCTRYVLKARVAKGENSDIFRKKRRLFVPKTGLRKHGTIGKFWPVSITEIRQYFKAKERRLRLNYRKAFAFSLWLHDRCKCDKPIYSIQRRVAYRWETFEPWAKRVGLA